MSLEELAAAHGVATSYEDWAGRRVPVRPDAVVAALAALDVPAGSAQEVAAALVEVEDAPWRRMLPPSLVVRGSGSVELRAPEGTALHVELEDGGRLEVAVTGPALQERDGRGLRLVPLSELPLGWHRLSARSGDETDEAVLVVAPRTIGLPADLDRAWGWMVQLYSLRSRDSWCVGDYRDLATVVERTSADGAGLVLCNPLHAETPLLPLDPSPYSPSSRRFRSPVWLRVEDVPELAVSGLAAEVAALRPATEPNRVERDPAWRAKLAALELLWPHHRADALAAFRVAHGGPLEGFALFCALAEVHGRDWRAWPQDLRRPDAAGAAAARVQYAERVSFWCWVQMLVDEQLQDVARAAAAMTVGVVHDLAVGVSPDGADAWALQDALALGTTVGAPPDSFNQQGQDWGLPPWRPDRLREQGYAPFRELVGGVLRHADGLRIDHAMGLFRLWWVPPGVGPANGTYVSYDADAMLGVLALEAVRAGAVVVGEDLGTVEDRVEVMLGEAGVLGSDVLWFARDDDGAFLAPAQWRELSLATVTTHDLPTAAGLLAGEQVRVRDELGLLGVPLEQEQARADDERTALLAMLETEGLLAPGGDPALAMHAALAAAPSRLVLAAYGDAVGDLRQPNMPGTVDAYPNWRLPVADGHGRPLGLEELLDHPGVAAVTRVLAAGVTARPVASAAATRPADAPARRP